MTFTKRLKTHAYPISKNSPSAANRQHCPEITQPDFYSATHPPNRRDSCSNRVFSVLLGIICVALGTASANAQKPGILVPAGFRVDHYADDDLAHDICSLTIDSKGRVVVSGPGYVRILIDSDNDGKADTFTQFADGPVAGAQGMHFMGPHLICTGDEGLVIYYDNDADDKADGPPTTILKIKSGNEHDVHSIQRGPDGWWYIIAGNMADVDASYAKLATSPIKNPTAGVLMRLRPDFFEGEIVADGLRNAYDFAFNPAGDLFTFDSDGERDVSLPWYQPCRVIQLTPRSNAGWVSRSWKRPGYFPDMPPVIADFGRGSPTGVACYRHVQFPSRYDGALFVLDWTFGRVLAISMTEEDGLWKSTPAVFAKGTGNFGFAPTDAEVAADGSLFVSVGGRGSRGSVFRFVYAENEQRLAPQLTAPQLADGATAVESLNFVLGMPQPQSSWSLARWQPVAIQLGEAAFVAAALDEGRRPIQRVRAIEILTSLFNGPDPATAQRLTNARSVPVRARTAWSVSRSNPTSPNADVLFELLDDEDPLVIRSALEALTTVQDELILNKCLPRIAVALGSESVSVRKSAANVIANLNQTQRDQVAQLTEVSLQAAVWLAIGATQRSEDADPASLAVGIAALQQTDATTEQRLEAVRLIQLSLGDVGPAAGVVAAFESYTAKADLNSGGLPLAELRVMLASSLPSGDVNPDSELIRTIAMLGSTDRPLIGKLLATITPPASAAPASAAPSSPTADIHRLAAISRIQAARTAEESSATAAALVNLEIKIHQQNLKQDSNWEDRVNEIFDALSVADPMMPSKLPDQRGFGLPGHVMFLRKIAPDKTQQAIDNFAARIQADPDYEWSRDVAFVLARSSKAEHLELVRGQLQNPAIVDAVLLVMSRDPLPADRGIYLQYLDSVQLNAVEASLTALLKLPRTSDAAEQFTLLNAARRLNHDKREFGLRENAIRLLQNNLGQSFAFTFGEEGHNQQLEAIGRWADFLKSRYPDFTPTLAAGQDAAAVLAMLPDVEWDAGDASAGKQLFTKLTCAKCHSGRKALGPDLQGVAKRFARPDLFVAVVDPNRDVSSQFQMTTIATTSGKTYSGMVVYESVDGLILRDADQNSYRIEAEDIESKVKVRASLMPAGLLKNVSAKDLADLHAYMRDL